MYNPNTWISAQLLLDQSVLLVPIEVCLKVVLNFLLFLGYICKSFPLSLNLNLNDTTCQYSLPLSLYQSPITGAMSAAASLSWLSTVSIGMIVLQLLEHTHVKNIIIIKNYISK